MIFALRTRLRALLLVGVFLGIVTGIFPGVDSELVFAGNGQVYLLPAPRTKIRSGLRLSIDTRWVVGDGYRPVRVRISPITGGTAVADRDIQVRIRPSSWYGNSGAAVKATVHMDQGATFGEAVVDIPQTNTWNMIDVDAFEGGNFLPDLHQDNMSSMVRYYYDQGDGSPTILLVNRFAPGWTGNPRVPVYTGIPNTAFVIRPEMVSSRSGVLLQPLLLPMVLAEGEADPANLAAMPGIVPPVRVAGKELRMLPDIRGLASRFPRSFANGYITADRFLTTKATTDAETMRLVNDISFIEMLPPAALPDRWLSYSGIDVLIISAEELQMLAASYPEKWKSLRTWLATGTTLIVYGAGKDYERLSAIDTILDAQPLPVVSGEESLRGWTRPSEKQFKEDINVLETANRNVAYYRQATVVSKPMATPAPPATPTEKDLLAAKPRNSKAFVFRQVDQGYVVALASDNPFGGDPKDWSWIFNTIPSRSWLWYQRNGISNTRTNDHFWNFLIPDIGRAPVLSFLALITLFAVVIGPVNYFLLLRRGRLYLLLVTVPAGAMFITAGLFIYATTADGLGTRARLRSCTTLDQRRGQAVTMSRQTYYAGFAPSQGFTYPGDAAVYPLDYQPFGMAGSSNNRRELVWGDDQHLERGYFLSRMTSQLLVVEPEATSSRLKIEESQGKPPMVVNELQTTIERLVLCDSSGKYFTAANILAGATSELIPTDLSKESDSWRGLYGQHRPAYPENFDPSKLENVSEFFGSGGYPNQSDVPMPMFDTSVLETQIREAMTTNFRSLKPRTYFAIVQRPPNVSIGVEAPHESASFHLIVGKW